MADIEFYPNPTEQEYAQVIASQAEEFDEDGGIWVAMMKYERSVRYGGDRFNTLAATALVAQHIEPRSLDGEPYDAYLGKTHAFRRGMMVGFSTVGFVHTDTVTTGNILRTFIHSGVTAVDNEGEYESGLLSEDVLKEMGKRGLRLVGREANEVIDRLSREITFDAEKQEGFRHGYGAVMHIADALHIQYNMQQHDLFVSSDDWTSELDDMSRLNTGE